MTRRRKNSVTLTTYSRIYNAYYDRKYRLDFTHRDLGNYLCSQKYSRGKYSREKQKNSESNIMSALRRRHAFFMFFVLEQQLS
jgi:hypothetical protein